MKVHDPLWKIDRSLEMYSFAIRHFNCVFHALRNGRVWVNAIQYFMISCFKLPGRNRLNDYFGNVITNHMRT